MWPSNHVTTRLIGLAVNVVDKLDDLVNLMHAKSELFTL